MNTLKIELVKNFDKLVINNRNNSLEYLVSEKSLEEKGNFDFNIDI